MHSPEAATPALPTRAFLLIETSIRRERIVVGDAKSADKDRARYSSIFANGGMRSCVSFYASVTPHATLAAG